MDNEAGSYISHIYMSYGMSIGLSVLQSSSPYLASDHSFPLRSPHMDLKIEQAPYNDGRICSQSENSTALRRAPTQGCTCESDEDVER